MTVLDMIKASMRMLGVLGSGDAPDSTEEADALHVLNNLIGQWSRQRYLIPVLTTESLAMVAAQGSYTWGTGGNWTTAQPITVTAAIGRSSNNLDFVILPKAWENYNWIEDKLRQGPPEILAFRPGAPGTTVGTLVFWPVPDAAYSFIPTSHKAIGSFATTGATVTLPDEYPRAIEICLAWELWPQYPRKVVYNWLQAERVGALQIIKSLRAEPVPEVAIAEDLQVRRLGLPYR